MVIEKKRLSDAELEIMLAIWHSDGPVTSSYVLEQLEGKRKWKLSTLMTVLSRLSDKGYLECDRSTRTNLYSAVITESEYKAGEGKGLLEKLYSNSLQNMVASLYNEKAIDDQDLADLVQFLDELDRGK